MSRLHLVFGCAAPIAVFSSDAVAAMESGGCSANDTLYQSLRPANAARVSCFVGNFTEHRCCRIQDPRCFDNEFTFASCCSEQQRQTDEHEQSSILQGNRKGVGTMDIGDSYSFHLHAARQTVGEI